MKTTDQAGLRQRTALHKYELDYLFSATNDDWLSQKNIEGIPFITSLEAACL